MSEKMHIVKTGDDTHTLCGWPEIDCYTYVLERVNPYTPIRHLKKEFEKMKPKDRCNTCYNILKKMKSERKFKMAKKKKVVESKSKKGLRKLFKYKVTLHIETEENEKIFKQNMVNNLEYGGWKTDKIKIKAK